MEISEKNRVGVIGKEGAKMITFGMANIEEIQQINRLAEEKQYPFSGLYMVCRKGGELAGFCVIRVHSDCAELIDAQLLVEDRDDALKIVLIKSALNAIDLAGTKDVFCKNADMEDILQKLEFSKTNENSYVLNLEGYFKPCSCKTAKFSK